MIVNRVLALFAIAWLMIVAASLEPASYAQEEVPFNKDLELPYRGKTHGGTAFYIVNTEDEASFGIDARARIGVAGRTNSNNFGIGVAGTGHGTGGVGVSGEGSWFGVGGMSGGMAGVYGRYSALATAEYQGINPGEAINPTHGMLAAASTGVKGIVSSAIEEGTGVTGIYAPNIVDTWDVTHEWGVNRGFLGASTAGVYGESDLENGIGVGAR